MRRCLASLAFMLFIEVGIPLALYYGLKSTVGVVYALVISGVSPVLWVIFQFIRKRKFDILGCIIALSFILSGVVFIDDPRAALIRDQAVGAVIGLMFLLTLISLRTKWIDIRPLTYIVAMQIYEGIYYRWTDRDGNRQEQSFLHWQWDNVKLFRVSMYIPSGGWAFFLIMSLVACILMVNISNLSVDQIVMLNNIIGIAITVTVMTTVSIVFLVVGRRAAMRIGKARTAENDFTYKFGGQQREQQQDGQTFEIYFRILCFMLL